MNDISTPSVTFPVEMKANWLQEPTEVLAQPLRDWLLDPCSLTARLKKYCSEFHVEVLGQRIERCSAQEATDEVTSEQEVLIREVLLFCDGVPHVFARSLLPLSSLTGNQRQLANLGDQPLGQVIFSHPNLKRSRIELASFEQDSSVGQLAQLYGQEHSEKLWGRRSVFILENKPFIVAEVFLPEAVAYQKERVC